MGIERKVNDIENLYIRFSSNCTSPDNIFKETVMLKSRAYYEYILQGYILGNNVNIFHPDVESGFTGAVVGNPLLNSHTGYKLFGQHSMYVFSNVIDMDLNKVPLFSDE